MTTEPAAPSAVRAELLAPAGGRAELRAAAAAGADAVYFGLRRFSARGRAENFSPEELPEIMAWLHDRALRGYLAMNTLVFASELSEAAELLAAAARAGVDAVIVQDLGLARLARRLAPGLALHASTQMSLSEPRGVALAAAELGVRRVIVPRELSVAEIAALAAECPGVALEVFVHGALCVSFSGQCLASASLGGRSANRGWCAQPCRLPYELLASDKKARPAVGASGHPLSPLDLAAHDRLGALLAAGVRCFKIEGRLKPARYVAAAVRVYREALDAALAGRPYELPPARARELTLSFSRGFARGWLDGPDHAGLTGARRAPDRGLPVGVAAGRTARGLLARLSAPVKPGDGLLVGTGEDDEPAGRVYQVLPRADGTTELRFSGRLRWPEKLPAGVPVWKTSDPEVDRRLDALAAAEPPAQTAVVDVEVSAAAGEPLHVVLRDREGAEVRVSGGAPLEAARSHPLTLETLGEHFGRLGGTPFRLGEVTAARLEPVMVPRSALNQLRRRAVQELAALRARRRAPAEIHPEALASLLESAGLPEAAGDEPDGPYLAVLARTAGQAAAAAAWRPPAGRPGVRLVWVELGDAREWPGAMDSVRKSGVRAGLALPRMALPGEERLLEAAAAARPDAVLVRNLAGLEFFRAKGGARPELVGDFSLNAANALAAGALLARGLARLTPAYEVGPDELAAVLERLPAGRFEPVLWRHVPMFHTRHCLHGAWLARSASCGGCPRPCRGEKLRLRDRKGERLAVTLDAARRTTVWGARAQCDAEGAARLVRCGVRAFRVELLGESPVRTGRLLDAASALLAGELEPSSFRKCLGASRRPAERSGGGDGG